MMVARLTFSFLLVICALRDVVTWFNPHVLSSLVGLGVFVFVTPP